MEKQVRRLKESLNLPLDQYPVDVVSLASALGVMVYDVEFKNPNISSVLITDPKRVPKGIVPGERATILVAKDEYPTQKALLIAHELGHLVLGHADDKGILLDFSRGKGTQNNPHEEREANLFAITLLIPEEPFRIAWNALAQIGAQHIAVIFGVPVNAVLARAKELGLEVPLP